MKKTKGSTETGVFKKTLIGAPAGALVLFRTIFKVFLNTIFAMSKDIRRLERHIVPDGQLAKRNMLSTVNKVHLFKDNFEVHLYFLLTDRLVFTFC